MLIQVGEMASLFFLFSQFYKKSYGKKKRRGKGGRHHAKDECNVAIGEGSSGGEQGKMWNTMSPRISNPPSPPGSCTPTSARPRSVRNLPRPGPHRRRHAAGRPQLRSVPKGPIEKAVKTNSWSMVDSDPPPTQTRTRTRTHTTTIPDGGDGTRQV